METQKKKVGRPRKENKALYTTIIMTKLQRDRLDNYMFDNRVKMSYSKFIDFLIDERQRLLSRDIKIKELLK